MSDYALTARLPHELAARDTKVTVVGDAILDVWIAGEANRLCREAPAPVVSVHSRDAAPGGAANTAANLAALGADVTLVSVVGADDAGTELIRLLTDAGVNTDHVLVVPGAQTVAKRRVIATDHLMLRFDEGERQRLDVGDTLAEATKAAVDGADAVLVCDYGLGTLSDEVADALARARDAMPLLVIDAHHLARWRDLRPDLVTPNAAETADLLGTSLPDGEARVASIDADRVREASGADVAVVTLDRDGALVLAADTRPHRTWADPAPENYAAGAGDTFAAALTLAVAAGVPAPLAAEFAQAAANVVVHRPGTGVCTAADLSAHLSTHHATLGAEDLARRVAEHRAAGRRIVFTNGCFDVLHRGHIAYLNQAKRHGDVLVVAVNDDASTRRLKGPGRPVNAAADRAAVLAALSCVDHVTIFATDSPTDLIRSLRPDIYAKGGDYTEDMLTETKVVHEHGGEVHILDYVPDHSTTAVIDRITATTR